jgi:alpha-L-fucosidase
MKKLFLHFLIIIFSANFSFAQEAQQPLNDDERMAWWRDASFGMFIHWGAYAVPGGARNGEVCRGGAEWIMDKLDYTIDDYEKDVVAKFNPVKFNADEWVAMAKDAGMKYIVLTSKHHDGFCLWDSKITDYDIMEARRSSVILSANLLKHVKEEESNFAFITPLSIGIIHRPRRLCTQTTMLGRRISRSSILSFRSIMKTT